MARIPGWLLRHTVTVQPYQGTWGAFGLATSVKCFQSERLSTVGGASGAAAVGSRESGVERIAQITLYAPPDTSLPAGSKVTLADGRVGYISASVLHDGGGLPTPDHVEAAVAVGSEYGPAFGETVILLRRTIVGQDRYHNDRYSTSEIPVAGCAVSALSSAEALSNRDQVTDAIEVVMPPGTTVLPTDRLRVRGLTYEVDGTPDLQVSSATGAAPGVRVVAKRVAG